MIRKSMTLTFISFLLVSCLNQNLNLGNKSSVNSSTIIENSKINAAKVKERPRTKSQRGKKLDEATKKIILSDEEYIHTFSDGEEFLLGKSNGVTVLDDIIDSEFFMPTPV